MQLTNKGSASGRLILRLKIGYWAALFIVAAMVTASYLMLHQMMAEHRDQESALSLAREQKTLSQRVVLLANATLTVQEAERRRLVAVLGAAIEKFEENQDRLSAITGMDSVLVRAGAPETIEGIFYSAPHHLDHFALELAVSARRLVAAQPDGAGAAGYRGGDESATLNSAVAEAALAGFAALEDRMAAFADARLDSLLNLNRTLYIATIVLLGLIAIGIFRPMVNAIDRRTRELVDARNSMAFLAVHDGLTGLHNRSFLIDHFDTVIQGAHRRGERLAVIQLDLDRFKQVNDTLGHHAGDHVLIETAKRMRASCRASDLCVRLGGDEFVMVLNAAGNTEDISGAAQRVLARINEPISYDGATILPGASAGIAVYPVDAQSAEDLLVHADLALYSAKKIGGGGFSFFSDELRRELEHRKQLEKELQIAIEKRAFEVHFQPQVSLADGRITGVEALVRWHHPERGLVSPGEFIPVAEKSGLMVAIGRIILERAIAEAAEWHHEGLEFGRLAINVSGGELREADFSAFLFSTLSRTGLPPGKLSLEIVESVILDDEKTGIAPKLRQIRAAGIHLELDDFGTGYASLSHVNPNEIDRLKIDRRFVQNIHLNGDNTKIVRAITELARGLGIAIVAEGAETEAELDRLMAIGCDEVQGFSVAFPMPDRQARDWIAAHGGHVRRIEWSNRPVQATA